MALTTSSGDPAGRSAPTRSNISSKRLRTADLLLYATRRVPDPGVERLFLGRNAEHLLEFAFRNQLEDLPVSDPGLRINLRVGQRQLQLPRYAIDTAIAVV